MTTAIILVVLAFAVGALSAACRLQSPTRIIDRRNLRRNRRG